MKKVYSENFSAVDNAIDEYRSRMKRDALVAAALGISSGALGAVIVLKIVGIL